MAGCWDSGDLPNWKTVVPRLGLLYDLLGKGKTVLKAAPAVQQEIMPQFVVSVGYYYRQNRNNLGIGNCLVPSSDYTP